MCLYCREDPPFALQLLSNVELSKVAVANYFVSAGPNIVLASCASNNDRVALLFEFEQRVGVLSKPL